METHLDQLVDRFQQIVWQLETLEAVFARVSPEQQNQHRSSDSEASDASRTPQPSSGCS